MHVPLSWKVIVATLMLAVTAPLALAAGAGASSTGGSSALTVELDWVPNPDHVALYYARDEGYFAKQGLSVSLEAPSNAADPLKLVGLNKVDLGVSYESEIFYGQEEGLPITVVSTLIPVPLNSLIVRPQEHVTKLVQMRGKTIGITGIPSDFAIIKMLLRTTHSTPAQIKTVTVGENLVPSLLSGRVDAIEGGYRNVEAIQIAQELGQKPTVFPVSDLGVPSYAELVVVANRDRLESSPAYATAVRRFLAGLSEGAAAAMAHPGEATAIMEKDTQYTTKFLKVSVPYTLSLMKPPAGQRFGCTSEASWQSFGDWMASEKLITGKQNASVLRTDAYLPGC